MNDNKRYTFNINDISNIKIVQTKEAGKVVYIKKITSSCGIVHEFYDDNGFYIYQKIKLNDKYSITQMNCTVASRPIYIHQADEISAMSVIAKKGLEEVNSLKNILFNQAQEIKKLSKRSDVGGSVLDDLL